MTVVLILFSLYAVGWVLAVVGISRDIRFPIDERWAGSTMLVLQGTIALVWIAAAYSWRRSLTFAAIVVPLAFACEYVGVTTGFPFGAYHYTGALAPTILNTVPAPITLAWLMIALGSLALAQTIVSRPSPFWVIALSALFATALDFSIEPTAYHIKAYWLWEQTGRYYGVPVMNFLGWYAVACVINGLGGYVLGRGMSSRVFFHSLVPVDLFCLTALMFTTIDFFRGYPVGAAVGGILVCIGVIPTARVFQARHANAPTESLAPSTPRAPANASGSSLPESRENSVH